jgi:hypothetical protein
VPSLSGLSVGPDAAVAGPAASALATSADDTIVDSSGTFYVFAGGRAFGIPSPGVLVTLKRWDPAVTLSGPVGAADASAAVADGTLLSARGQVYVTYEQAGGQTGLDTPLDD